MIRRPPRSTLSSSSAASDVYKRQPLDGAIGNGDPGRVPQKKAAGAHDRHGLRLVGPEVLLPAGERRSLVEEDGNAVKGDVLDVSGLVRKNHGAILGTADQVGKPDVTNDPEPALPGPRHGHDLDRLAATPPHRVEDLRLDDQIREEHPLDGPLEAQPDGHAPVAVLDGAVAHHHVANVARSIAAHDNAGGARHQGAAGDDHILTGPGDAFAQRSGFQRDAIIAGGDVTAVDADVGGPVDVDPVVVGHFQVGIDPDRLDDRVIAAEEPQGPIGGVRQGNIPQQNVPAFLENDSERAGEGTPVNERSGFGDVSEMVSVNPPGAGDRDVLSLLGINNHAQFFHGAGFEPCLLYTSDAAD